jgi:hypothetical protein
VEADYPSEYYVWAPGSDLSFSTNVLQDVTIMGKPQSPDGTVWTLLPAGEVIAATPKVLNVAFFGEGPTFTTPSLTGLTVVSNAWQINASNWVTVMTNGGYVTVQASLDTTDTNAASLIKWPAFCQPVPGQPFQRQLSTSTPTNFTVTATLGSTNLTINVWIMWATMNILTTGTLPSNAPPFRASYHQGIQNQDGTTNILGSVYWHTNDAGASKICTVATLSPPGLATILTNGFQTIQFCWQHRFVNGIPSTDPDEWNTNWVNDSPGNYPSDPHYTTAPDPFGNLYSNDAPEIFAYEGVTTSLEIYRNFEDCLTFNGFPCSTTNIWYFAGRWTNSGPTYQIHMNIANPTNITH